MSCPSQNWWQPRRRSLAWWWWGREDLRWRAGRCNRADRRLACQRCTCADWCCHWYADGSCDWCACRCWAWFHRSYWFYRFPCDCRQDWRYRPNDIKLAWGAWCEPHNDEQRDPHWAILYYPGGLRWATKVKSRKAASVDENRAAMEIQLRWSGRLAGRKKGWDNLV